MTVETFAMIVENGGTGENIPSTLAGGMARFDVDPLPSNQETLMATKKATKKLSAKKAAANAAENLVLGVGAAPGAALTTPLTDAGQFKGNVHYAGVAAVLVAPGAASLLIMFKPSGNYTPADIGAAASQLRFVLGKQEGAPISVSGHAGDIFGKPCIFMISVS